MTRESRERQRATGRVHAPPTRANRRSGDATWSAALALVALVSTGCYSLTGASTSSTDAAGEGSAARDAETDGFEDAGPPPFKCLSNCPVALAKEQNGAYALTLSGSTLYWTNLLGGTVMSVSTTGTMLTTVASGQDSPFAIAKGASRVFWATSNTVDADGGVSNGRVLATPPDGGVDGGAEGGAVVVASNQNFPTGSLAINDAGLFWASANGQINELGLSNERVSGVAYGQVYPYSMAVDRLNLYWTVRGGDSGLGGVTKRTFDGGVVGPVATSVPSPTAIAVCADTVYWTSESYGSVMSAPVAGGTATLIASSQYQPGGVACDESNVYWTDTIAGTVLGVPVKGGTPVTYAVQQDSPYAIVLDAQSLYWTAASNVMKLPSKSEPEKTMGGSPPPALDASAQEGGTDSSTVDSSPPASAKEGGPPDAGLVDAADSGAKDATTADAPKSDSSPADATDGGEDSDDGSKHDGTTD